METSDAPAPDAEEGAARRVRAAGALSPGLCTALVGGAVLAVFALVLAAVPRGGGGGGGGAGPGAAGEPPLLVVVSLDGFRHDYLTAEAAPTLTRLGEEGVRAAALRPAFPSKTFPNHYTLATGLFPESHGIVDNVFLDPADGAVFDYGDRAAVLASRWWGGEPLWVTAERWGVRAGVVFWPGSEAAVQGVRPSLVLPYNGAMSGEERVDTLLRWLDLPREQRPALLMAYFSEVDSQGHRHGPDAPEVVAAVRSVDACVARLLRGLEARGLAARANVVVVSDHGMAAASTSRVVFLRSLLDAQRVYAIDSGAMVGVWPRRLDLEPAERDALLAEAVANLTAGHANVSAWRREQVPQRFNYRASARIAPVVALADEGWFLDAAHDAPAAPPDPPQTFGQHGFDPALPRMGGILLARGPAFLAPAQRAPGGEAAPGVVDNVDVYPLGCWLLRLAPAPCNGSVAPFLPALRTPLH